MYTLACTLFEARKNVRAFFEQPMWDIKDEMCVKHKAPVLVSCVDNVVEQLNVSNCYGC